MSSVLRVTFAAAAMFLAACGSEPSDSGTSSTTATTAPSVSTLPANDTSAPAEELAGFLATPSDLGTDWSLWDGFAAWPGGTPGLIPDDHRDVIPSLPMCPTAGDAAVALAETLEWQAFTQLHRATPDPLANMVVVQQFLVAEDPVQAADKFATLRDGLTRCLTANLNGEWEIGLRESLPVPEVGDNRFAERSLGVDPGGARRDTRWVLVQDGGVLMLIRLDDVLISPDAEPALTPETVDAVITAMAAALP